MIRDEESKIPKQRHFVNCSFVFRNCEGSTLSLRGDSCGYCLNYWCAFSSHEVSDTFDACLAVCRRLQDQNKKGNRYSGVPLDMVDYIDSDYCASNHDNQRLTFGYVLMMACGPVSWISKLQPIVCYFVHINGVYLVTWFLCSRFGLSLCVGDLKRTL